LFLTLSEEFRLKVSENRVLRRIFGRKRDEVAGGWRRLHNEELHNLYASPNVIKVIKSRRMMWAEHVALIGQMRNAYKILVVRSKRKRPLGRPWRKWEGNNGMNLRMGRCELNASCSGQERVWGFCEHGNEPSGKTDNFLTS
jgi:hypothetical protein